MTTRTIAADRAQQPGLCLDCNYALRELPANVCPECGRAFDPSDRRTMNMGRPIGRLARRLLAPVGTPTWVVLATSAAVMLWGWAWLPGGVIASAAGFWGIVAVYPYRLWRWLLREVVRITYEQPADLLGRHERRPRVPTAIMGVVGVCIALNLPLVLAVQASRLIVDDEMHRMYAVDPMPHPGGGTGPRWVGLFYADRVSVGPNGVEVRIRGGGVLRYSPDRADPYGYTWVVGPWYASPFASW